MNDALTVTDILIAARRLAPKIIESPWVPEGSAYVMNDLNLPVQHPEGWETMTAEQKIAWAVDNGMAVVVRNLG